MKRQISRVFYLQSVHKGGGQNRIVPVNNDNFSWVAYDSFAEHDRVEEVKWWINGLIDRNKIKMSKRQKEKYDVRDVAQWLSVFIILWLFPNDVCMWRIWCSLKNLIQTMCMFWISMEANKHIQGPNGNSLYRRTFIYMRNIYVDTTTKNELKNESWRQRKNHPTMTESQPEDPPRLFDKYTKWRKPSRTFCWGPWSIHRGNALRTPPCV